MCIEYIAVYQPKLTNADMGGQVQILLGALHVYGLGCQSLPVWVFAGIILWGFPPTS